MKAKGEGGWKRIKWLIKVSDVMIRNLGATVGDHGGQGVLTCYGP